MMTLLHQQDIYQRSLKLTRRRSKTPLPQKEQEHHRQSHCFGSWLLQGLGTLYYETNYRQWEQLLCCFMENLPVAVELEQFELYYKLLSI